MFSSLKFENILFSNKHFSWTILHSKGMIYTANILLKTISLVS